MKYRTRTFYTDSQKAVMWEPWKEGATLHLIAKLFDRAHSQCKEFWLRLVASVQQGGAGPKWR